MAATPEHADPVEVQRAGRHKSQLPTISENYASGDQETVSLRARNGDQIAGIPLEQFVADLRSEILQFKRPFPSISDRFFALKAVASFLNSIKTLSGFSHAKTRFAFPS